MRNAMFVGLVLFVGATGCGDGGQAEPHVARTLWGTLGASHVARPFALEELTGSAAAVSPRCPGGGEAHGELWHTAFQVDGEGEASGTARYVLDGCRAPQQELALHGNVQRGFKVRRQLQMAPGAAAEQMGLERKDTFVGELHLTGAANGSCWVEVTRLFDAGTYTYAGTLCGHDVVSLGLSERFAP